jgi:antitoxin (DNA-binding transcriptional repressor) of toxin-antitoxin stability system
MAVIHVTEEEAAVKLPHLLARVRAGEELHIGDGKNVFAIVQPPRHHGQRKTLSEAIRWAEEQDLQILLDDNFGDDLEQVICNHEHESMGMKWED